MAGEQIVFSVRPNDEISTRRLYSMRRNPDGNLLHSNDASAADKEVLSYVEREFDDVFKDIFTQKQKDLLRKAGKTIFDIIVIDNVSVADKYADKYKDPSVRDQLLKAEIFDTMVRRSPNIQITPVNRAYFWSDIKAGEPIKVLPMLEMHAQEASTAASDVNEMIRQNIVFDPKAPDANLFMANPAPHTDFNVSDKLWRKNLLGIKQVQQDFGARISYVTYQDNTIQDNSLADARGGVNPRIRFNLKELSPDVKKDSSYVKYRVANGDYKFSAASRNYTGHHEAGHIVNYEIVSKLWGYNPHAPSEGDNVQKYNNHLGDLNSRVTGGNIVLEAIKRVCATNQAFKDAFIQQAKSPLNGHSDDIDTLLTRTDIGEGAMRRLKGMGFGWQNAQLKMILGQDRTNQLKVTNKFDFSLLTRDEEEKIKTELINSKYPIRDDIYYDLYRLKHTSGYGATNQSEVIAEAFADFYHTKNKNEIYKEKSKEPGHDPKYDFRFVENPISKAITDISKELMMEGPQGEINREEFKRKYPASNYTMMTDEQLQNTRALAQEQAEQEAKAAQKVQEDMLAQADIVEISIDEIMAARKEIPAGKKQARNAPANRKNANVVNVVKR